MIYDKPIPNRGPLWLREINDMEHEPYESTSLPCGPLPALAPPMAQATQSDPHRPRAVERRALLDSAVPGDAQVVTVTTPSSRGHYYCEDCDEQIAMEDVDQILDDMEPTCPRCGECVEYVPAERPA